MRILVLTDRYPPHYEGAYELNCQQVVDGLAARGHEIVVLTSMYGVGGPVIQGPIMRRLHSIDPVYRGRLHRRLMQGYEAGQRVANYWITRQIGAQIKPDLVFIWHMLAVSVLPILAVQDLGIPTVYRVGSHWLVMLHREYVREPYALKRLYRSALMGFRRFEEVRLGPAIVVSSTLRANYEKAGFDMSQSAVIPSGIPPEWLAARPPALPSNGSPRVLYVGRIEKEKGVEVALAALAILNQSYPVPVYLDLIGRGQPAYLAHIRQLIARDGLVDRVRLVDFIPRDELLKRYGAYPVLLFTSLHLEGLPMTIVEAMAQGLTVIASDIVGPRDIIVNGHNGFLVPPGNAQALSDALIRILKHPQQHQEIGQAAIETVRKDHLFDRMLDGYESVLLAARHVRPGGGA